MSAPDSPSHYIFILLVLFSQAGVGRRLGIRSPLLSILVGLCGTGLVVGVLANVCAGLIRPFILLACAGGVALTVHDLWTARGSTPLPWARIIFLGILGLCMLFAWDVHTMALQKTPQGTFLDFNQHDSYYASQTTEMLHARYMERLRMAHTYPYPWSAYHFFTSGALATLQGLIPEPGLFSFYKARAFLVVFLLLSLLEFLLICAGDKGSHRFLVLLWLLTGLSIYFDTLRWNVCSNGAFSFWAIILTVWALVYHRPRESAIFALILGASAFRMVPIAVLGMAGLLVMTPNLKWGKNFGEPGDPSTDFNEQHV